MKIDLFIRRPVLAAGISIIIVLLGIISITQLPVEKYPNMAPPTVVVSANYTGANAQTLQRSVIAPLEEAINGVENMTYMTSTAATGGQVTITVYFRPGTDADMAAVNVQNRVNASTSLLPAEVVQAGITTNKQENTLIMEFALYTDDESKFDRIFIANWQKLNVEPALLRIPGVGSVNAMGQEYSMRLWLRPDKMAQFGLVPQDIADVLDEQNIEVATGSLGEKSDNAFQYTLRYTGRLQTPEEFGNMVIKALPHGEVLRVKDVAEVEMGSLEETYTCVTNGKSSVYCMVYQQPGANATKVVNDIENYLREVEKELPQGLHLQMVDNANAFLSASISNVVETLIEAVLLVILVVFVFLQNLRSTLIPTISILVSLVGTFAFLSLVGFSINLLTLFALVLVIGTVVDDSIVVVEAVQSKFEEGYVSPYLATHDGMKGIAGAIVTCSLVFMVVFIPVSFSGGVTGTFYKQFGITMAVAVGISAVNALTLCPALCAIVMRHDTVTMGFTRKLRSAYNVAYGVMLGKYRRWAFFFIKRRWLAGTTVVVSVLLFAFLMKTTRTGMIPQEDLGLVRMSIMLPQGSSLHATDRLLYKIDSLLNDIDDIESKTFVSGFNQTAGHGPAGGNAVFGLKPWSERKHTAEEITAEINERVKSVTEASIMAFTPPTLPGYGNTGGFELYVLDRSGHSAKELHAITQEFLAKLNERPEIGSAYTTFSPDYPQYEVSVDAAKAKIAGVSPDEVLRVIQGYVGSLYASNFNRFNKPYRVILQALPEYRLDEQSLHNMYVRVGEGSMAPVSQFAKLRRVYDAENLYRFNLYSSITVNGSAAEGYSSGDAIRAIEETAGQYLPQGYGYDLGGLSRTERESGNDTGIILALSVVFIYIILSMLYESYFIPFAVLLSVPFGLVGSFLFVRLFGLENNIYLQMGLVMLIGLLAKTAILLTEYATTRRREGLSLTFAAFTAARERLRPILMTALTMIVGLLPMMFSTGVGANGNRSLGTGVVGGMLVGSLALLLLVPSLFVVFQWLQEKVERHTMKYLPKTTITVMCIVFAASTLTSCGVYSSYQHPENVADNALFRNESSAIDTTQSMAELSWREMFTDSCLQTLIEQGLKNNADLRIAELRIEEAAASLQAAKLAFLPGLSLGADGGLSKQEGEKAAWTYDGLFSAEWELDFFGRLRNAKQQERARLEQSEDYRQTVQTGLVATIATDYYTLVMLHRQLALADSTLLNWQENVRALQAMMHAGTTNEAAVLQAEADLLAVEASRHDIRQSITEMENNLSALLGHAPGAIVVDWAEEHRLQKPVLYTGLPADLLSLRPDVRRAEAVLKEAFYATNSARAAFYPSIRLSAEGGWMTGTGAAITHPAQFIASAIGSLTQPLFAKGQLRRDLKITRSRQEQARVQFTQSLFDAGAEVSNALSAYHSAVVKRDVLASRAAKQEQAVRATRLLMRHSTNTSYIEVLTAQQLLLETRMDNLANAFDEAQSMIVLYRALGGGVR
ncbi:MAG: efflux RND transporter permease subunit [Bacteroides sp.]|nr:efflux RND transporter permease subunit [Bacteroides sp.]